tara:strand:+ start:257 stop:571 length:315 start_codon:yes stop_codon:yes gene_type:complete
MISEIAIIVLLVGVAISLLIFVALLLLGWLPQRKDSSMYDTVVSLAKSEPSDVFESIYFLVSEGYADVYTLAAVLKKTDATWKCGQVRDSLLSNSIDSSIILPS